MNWYEEEDEGCEGCDECGPEPYGHSYTRVIAETDTSITYRHVVDDTIHDVTVNKEAQKTTDDEEAPF